MTLVCTPTLTRATHKDNHDDRVLAKQIYLVGIVRVHFEEGLYRIRRQSSPMRGRIFFLCRSNPRPLLPRHLTFASTSCQPGIADDEDAEGENVTSKNEEELLSLEKSCRRTEHQVWVSRV